MSERGIFLAPDGGGSGAGTGDQTAGPVASEDALGGRNIPDGQGGGLIGDYTPLPTSDPAPR